MERIIPACAGSTCLTWRSTLPITDHPRVRGEHRWPCAWPWYGDGSSPRARGARTAAPTSTTSAIADHPRVRGEH